MATRSWNRVELIGNVTRDPELRYTPSGAAVCTFSIATNRTFVSDGEKREETDFHRCVSWNKLAELCAQLIKKGNRIFVSGRLQNRSWETPEGQNRQTTEIVIEDMLLLTSKPGGISEYSEETAPADRGVPTRSVEEMPVQKSDVRSQTSEKTDEPATSGDATVDKEKTEEQQQPEEEKPKKAEKAETENVDLDDLPF